MANQTVSASRIRSTALLKDRSIQRSPRERMTDAITRTAIYTVLTIGAIAALLPIYWMVISSLKPPGVLFQNPPEMFPSDPTLYNYTRLLNLPIVYRWLFNSTFVALAVTIGSLFLNSLSGYTLAKLRFPGRSALFWMILATMMVPAQATLVPLFILIRNFGWYDTYLALIVPSLSGAFGIFLMKQYMSTLPSSLIDAARLDGCSEFRIFRKVVLPMAKPALAVLGIFTFITNWNSFIWPLIMTSGESMRTLPVGLVTTRGSAFDFGMVMAGATFAAIPVVIVFLLFQQYFEKGLTVGALKG